MIRKKPALGLDPSVESGFPKRSMLKQTARAGCRSNHNPSRSSRKSSARPSFLPQQVAKLLGIGDDGPAVLQLHETAPVPVSEATIDVFAGGADQARPTRFTDNDERISLPAFSDP